MFGVTGFPEVLALVLFLGVYVGLVVVPSALICRRIGKSWWLGVIALVPVANVALLWFVATTRWEVSEKRGAA